MRRSTYSCETENEARQRVHQAIDINKFANWEMHGWASNSTEVLKGLKTDNNPGRLIGVDSGTCGVEKVLGLRWANSNDQLGFNFNPGKISEDIYNGKKKPTKREFLGVIMSVFDPLGFLTPFTIQSRILMQYIWSSGIGWDEVLRDEEFTHWQQWLIELGKIGKCSIPRCYQDRNYQLRTAELHVFCDASTKAYAAVAYWRFKLPNETFRVSIIMSKSRVAPLKVMSVPRLELQAALLATRLAKTIASEHDFRITRRIFWSDSKTVLHWIRKDPREFKIFVANRLSEIRENSEVNEWRWVPTKDNPADDGTRAAPNALDENSRWLAGPSFLTKADSLWPKSDVHFEVDTADLEFSKSFLPVANVVEEQHLLLNFSRFSSLSRLLSTVSRVLEAVDRWRNRSHSCLERKVNAEIICYKLSQSISFPEELNCIERSKAVPRSSRVASLNPFIDKDNVLRAEGRLGNFTSHDFATHPIILDGKEKFAQLLVKDSHERFYHGSHETVINELRQKFWIVGLRQALKSLVSKCIVCKIRRGLPAKPKMADLPPARLACFVRPFTHCGLDYFGPMQVKIGRRREKRWGALFTCMTTRAIHIELAHSLSTDSAIMAFRRFSAVRGTPVCVYSDNGTNFRGMDRELKQAIRELNRTEINNFACKNNIEWKFNPPTASHMGGAWERMIRSVKTALGTVLKEQAPREEVLITLLAEVAHCVNSRPLTHVSTDPRDDEALTPNHFLLGSSSGQIRISRCDLQTTCPRKQWRLAQSFADAFWRRWLREFLPTLMPRKKWRESEPPLKVGDIVLILDDNTERNTWRKGVITEVFPGADGQVRVAEVRTANGNLQNIEAFTCKTWPLIFECQERKVLGLGKAWQNCCLTNI
ncbi:uncharacterized protein LOC113464792 [Ceratina calcarata]|uniref:Uncharacterized protein LOC113464792 n=1 Tax=Ceratina calcarata TaxID=156304 RepID=A0AAJ7S6N4_9HYME|nr:uncharacterized protein LOC113464792 [Ceratina calcarata]